MHAQKACTALHGTCSRHELLFSAHWRTVIEISPTRLPMLQGIGYADVADVCLRGLHEPSAVNKTFELCYEFEQTEEEAMYELVAHFPTAETNYLIPALSGLERNT